MINRYLCLALAAIQTFLFSVYEHSDIQTIGVNKYIVYQTFEGFGTSS